MALENYTGNIADLVVTNPTPTDPKSQGDDHLRGIKYTLKQSFPNFDGPTTQLPGQVTPHTVTLGDSAPASGNHFWDGSIANQLTLKRGTPGAPGAELLKFLDGVASFPNQGQSLAASGYIKLPGGLVVQWGHQTLDGEASGTWNSGTYSFPIAFPNTVYSLVVTNANNASSSSTPVWITGDAISSTQYRISAMSSSAAVVTGIVANWIAIGY